MSSERAEVGSVGENMAASWLWAVCCVSALLASRAFCYKPVIIMHGILDHASDMQDLADFITSAHPGTNVSLINLFEELDCFKPLFKQTDAIIGKVRSLMKEAPNGVHMIGFSQGEVSVFQISK